MCEDDNEGEAVRGVRQELIRGIGNRAEDAASTAALLRGYLDSIGEPHDPSGPGWPPGGSP